MGRTAVVCVILAATIGIAGTTNGGIAEASPVGHEGRHAAVRKETGAHSSTRAASPKRSSARQPKAAGKKQPTAGGKRPAGRKKHQAARKKAAAKTVSYDGYTFRVPASWPVYRLSRSSTQCVRYDTSAVYLGQPGENQQCPAQLIGQADTVSIAASGSASQGRPVIDLQSAEVGGQVSAPAGPHPGLSVTATYGSDPSAVTRLLRSVRDSHTHAPVAIHQSAVTPPPAPSVVPAPSSAAPSSATAASSAAAAAGAAAAAAGRQQAALTPWQRAWIQRGLRWYPAGWYARGREWYLGTRSWSPAGWYPQAGPVTSRPTPAPVRTAPTPTPSPTGKGKTPKPTGKPTPKPSPTPKPTGKPSPKPTPKPSPTPPTHLRGSTPLPGFDTCTAPSLQTMAAWRKSYSAAAIYIGGAEMACDYGNLSASWVKSVKAMGWSLIPLYVGLQAPCNDFSQEIQPSHAAPEGTSAAQSAVADAKSFGLGTGTPIYFDMEAFAGGSSCRDSVLSFLNQWTRELHNLHYVSGVYSSAASGAEDLGNATSVYGHPLAKPDAMWFALWDDKANTLGMPYLLNTWWNPNRRIKQYQGSHWVKVNGDRLNVDSDWVQGPVY